MNYLKMFLGCALLFLTFQSFAQDRLYKKNGEIIEIKLLKLTSDEVTFKRFDNLDGPEYSVPKGDVFKIRYANGSSDVFEENNDKIGVNDQGKSIGTVKYMDKKTAPKDHNIIAFAPLLFTENGYGFGFTFERTLDKRGWVSFYCPAMFTYSSSTNYDPATGSNKTNNFNNPMFYLMPGIKFYTNLNSTNKVKHSLGVSLVAAFGNNTSYNYDYYTTTGTTTTASRTMLGAIATYGGNIFPTNHLYLGYDFGLGLPYLNNYDGQSHEITPLVEASLRIGYRFTKKAK